MKKITIFLSDSSSIEINDDNNELIKTYSENISDVLKSDNISILHMSSSSIVVRPNNISAIKINEISDKPSILQPKIKKENNDKSINTITD